MLLVSLGIVAFVFAKMDWENVHNYVDLLQVYNQFRSVSVNSHMVVVLYANVALIFGGYSLVCVPMMAWKRILLAVLEVLTCMSVFLSNGRTGVATTVLIVTALVCYILWQKKRILAVVCAAVCLAIGTFGAMLNPRANVDKAVNDPRNVIWEYSCELLKNHWLFGFGASGYSVEYVQQAYAHQRMKTEFIDGCLSHPMFLGAEKDCMMIHPHNAFLKIWLQFGILGLLIFVACLVLPIVFADRKRRFFVAIIVAVFSIQSTFEPFGIHISALLYAIVILAMNNEMSKSTNLPSRQPIR